MPQGELRQCSAAERLERASAPSAGDAAAKLEEEVVAVKREVVVDGKRMEACSR